MIERSCSKHIVLLGIGHTNAHIVRMWGMSPIPDVDLTCISNNTVATYSGMLPAVLAGQNPPADMEIDLVRLCSSVGARLITNPVTGIDHQSRSVLFEDRPAVPFDALSIGIGSVPSVDGTKMTGSSLLKIKPMQSFLDRLSDKTAQLRDSVSTAKALQVVIVGSGVAGIEILFCIRSFLKKHYREPFELYLVTRSKEILPAVGDSMRRKVLGEISSRRHGLTTDASVIAVDDDGLQLASGRTIPADLVIWATGATSPPDLAKFDLPTDDRGFLATDATLQSTTQPGVFAVGDTGTILSDRTPKAGVYAVRQGPILWQNLKNTLSGQPLVEYKPQRSFLRLINTGDGSAIGQWKGKAFSGRWVMSLKDSIDSGFMQKYQVDNSMSADGDAPMQCRGCGCKLGADALEAAIAAKASATIPLEDAAIIQSENGQTLLASTDFFSSPFQDAYLTGRIAAIHSASDIVATGGAVTHALANVVIADGNTQTQQKWLADFLAGARQEFDKFNASVVGGHTIVGPRTEVGFTVIGKCHGDPLRKSGLRAGDALMLSKPVGIGVLLAAHMRSQCTAADYENLMRQILTPQLEYAQIARKHGTTGMTDVTGFGLAGHLIEMLRESNLSATIHLNQLPIVQGTLSIIESGIESSLAPDNNRFAKWIDVVTTAVEDPRYRVLFDPQTCGGLLFGINSEQVTGLLEDCENAGLAPPVAIGQIEPTSGVSRLTVT